MEGGRGRASEAFPSAFLHLGELEIWDWLKPQIKKKSRKFSFLLSAVLTKKKAQTFIYVKFRRQKAFLRAGQDREEEGARTSRESRKRSRSGSGVDSS